MMERSKRPVTFLALFMVLVMIMTSALGALTVSAAELPFRDVARGSWYYSAVSDVYERGLMFGVKVDMFAPNNGMTRAQMVTLFSRLAGGDTAGKEEYADFTDVSKGAWYAAAVGWASSVGLVNGYEDGSFKPDQAVSRAETAVLFVRFMDYMFVRLPDAPKINAFADAGKIGKWAAADVEVMRLCGLLAGDNNGNFNPSSSVTRAEIAAILQRYFEMLPNALDEMYSRFDRILDLAETDGRFILITLGSASTVRYDRLNSEILSILGLSEDKYETVLKDSDIQSLKDSFTQIGYNATVDTSMSVGVKNSTTGEETKSKLLLFRFTKTEEHYWVDPDDFDSGIDDTLYQNMMKASEYRTGNIARLAAAIGKAQRGEDTTVAYIGGSLTQGAHAGTAACWAKVSFNYFQKHYGPNGKDSDNIKYRNAGIGGTGSDFGNLRLDHDVLAYSPDIVFVEFAVNDYSVAAARRETYESLVRTALKSENSPAVVIVLCMIGSRDGDTYTFMKELGDKYDLPVIDMNAAVWTGIDGGAFTFEEFAPDGCHPEEYGHQVMSDTVENFYRSVDSKIESASEDDLAVKPMTTEPITESRLEGIKILDGTTMTIESYGSFTEAPAGENDHFDTVWNYNKSDAEPSPMKIKASFKNLFVLAGGKEYVTYHVRIDGGDIMTINVGAGDRNHTTHVFEADVSGEHTVEIWLDSDFRNLDFTIGALACN